MKKKVMVWLACLFALGMAGSITVSAEEMPEENAVLEEIGSEEEDALQKDDENTDAEEGDITIPDESLETEPSVGEDGESAEFKGEDMISTEEPEESLPQESEEMMPEAADVQTGQAPALTEETKKSGWQESESGVQYYITDEKGTVTPAAGWQEIGGRTFYFNEEGYLQTGWQVIDGKQFYFKKTGAYGIKGALLTGIQNIGGKTYMFEKDGAPGERGAMLTGWQDYNGKTFYLKKTGETGIKGLMLTGFQSINSKMYYFKKTGDRGVKGAMLTGFQNIGKYTFFFKRTGDRGVKGVMFTGWQRIDGKVFYFKKTGAKNVKGAMLLGFQSIGGKRFYFKKTGNAGVKGMMFTGRQKIGGKYYCFKENGGYGIRGEQCDTWEWLLNKYQDDDSTRQLLFIQYTGGSSAQAVYYSKSGSSWKKVFTGTADVGSNGIDKAKEGDRKTPTGTFAMTGGFGIASDPGARMDYLKVNKYHYWCGDDSYYNTLIDIRKKSHSCLGEHLIDYKGVYDYGMFLNYNPQCIVGKGSAIFLHCKGNTGSTGGCIAVSRSNMIKILQTAQTGAKICIYPK